ncbi:MAG: hypothetical protein PVF56_02615 [Desulfobacterales bacterium]
MFKIDDLVKRQISVPLEGCIFIQKKRLTCLCHAGLDPVSSSTTI